VSSIDHFLWQTTFQMTGQMGDRDLRDFWRGAPRIRKTRFFVFRKWEILGSARCPKIGKSALSRIPRNPGFLRNPSFSRISRISQESQLFQLFPMWDTVGSPDLPDLPDFPKSMPNLRSEHVKTQEMDDILRNIVFQDTIISGFSEYSLKSRGRPL